MTPEFDVAIVGGGLAGLSLAARLQHSGLRLALIEAHPVPALPAEASWDARVYAISPGTAAFLQDCGAWHGLAPERVARVEAMEIYGDDGAARLDFSAYDAGLRELAFIVENRMLQHALLRALDPAALRVFRPAACSSLELGPHRAQLTLADGTVLAARLIVGADGADSWVREQAAIAVRPVDYGQLGVVANFSSDQPPRSVAYQWFFRDSVLALLPLPGGCFSMVWSVAKERGERLLALSPDALAAEVQAAAGGVPGVLRPLTPAAAFPLRLQRVASFVRPRVALVGDAAHNLHPLAGQGMNLGFRDARVLAVTLGAREARYDCGDHLLLRRYERARREDVAAMQFTTDALQKLFGHDAVWIARARNAGLRLVNHQPQIKNFLVRQAIA